jgi:hypothetical protein
MEIEKKKIASCGGKSLDCGEEPLKYFCFGER